MPRRRLFRFIVATIVPHILFTLDFYGVLLWVETEVSVLCQRVLSDSSFRWFNELTYLGAYSTVAIDYFDLVKRFALQRERDFSAVTASLVQFLRRVYVGRVRNVWRSINRLHCSTIVNNDLQWLGVEILQGADLVFSVNKPSIGTTTWFSDINAYRLVFAMYFRHHQRAAHRAELCCVRAVLDQKLG